MPSNLKIDDKLLNVAMKVGKHATKKETVSAALKEYVQRHRQKEICLFFGRVEYNYSYDYKTQRKLT